MPRGGSGADFTSNPYHYSPEEYVAIIFVVLFSISTIAHIFQAAILMGRRGWWLFPTVCLCGAGEILGWAGRIWSSKNVLSRNAFLIQITCLVLSPTPLLAAVFIISSGVIARVGTCYSRISPKNYSKIFLTFDVMSLCIQAGGGGLADSVNNHTSMVGGNIMLAGIVFQLVSIMVFLSCIGEFFYRYMKDKPLSKRETDDATLKASITPPHMNKKVQLMICGMMLTTFFLVVRALFRTAELSHGFEGKIAREQTVFAVFDGAMVVLAFYTLNFLHPGYLFKPESIESSIDEKSAPMEAA